jgi:hypothetical protein
MRAGQALRGSSEFHAWGDSNLYLRRHGNDLTLAVEHRAAASVPVINLELVQQERALALQLSSVMDPPETPPPSSIDERILAALRQVGHPLLAPQLQEHCRVRKSTLYARLNALTAADKLVRTAEGYHLPLNA